MSLEKGDAISGTVLDPNTMILYLSVYLSDANKDVCLRDLQSIDTEQWTLRKCFTFPKRRTKNAEIYHIFLIGDHHRGGLEEAICC